MNQVKLLLRQLFFYSSRQLLRRKRSYLSIFVTSAVLLALVMTFLELAESTYLREIDTTRAGSYHASILALPDNYTDEFQNHSRVQSVFTVPYTSLMASSDDTSKPAKITAESEEIDNYLGVRYLWGSPPVDGEIAVSEDLYRSYGYLTAGEENELYFTASRMTYYPLRISGIFTCSDSAAAYAFVTADTLSKIDAETGAKTKYDHYIRCKNYSDRYIATVLDDLFKDNRLPDTDYQQRRSAQDLRLTPSGKAKIVYSDYMNEEYLKNALAQQSAPVVLYSMPIIVIAALMMASFMANWISANASEYGILGAIGANRYQLCAISAGQILLIGLAASVPVIILSSAVSNIYISVYNSASSYDVDYIYSVPWLKLTEAALWWNVLSCLFTYVGIARLTAEDPYILISGSFRSRMPFVRESDAKLAKMKDKIRRIGVIRSLRQVKSAILPAVITSLVCIVCGVFVILLIAMGGNTVNALNALDKYDSDMIVSVSPGSSYERTAYITEENAETLEAINGVAKVGRFRAFERDGFSYDSRDPEERTFDINSISVVLDNIKSYQGKTVRLMNSQASVYTYAVDETSLDLYTETVIEGNPEAIFSDEPSLIIVESYTNPVTEIKYSVGDKITLSGHQIITLKNGDTRKFEYDGVTEFTVAAVIRRDMSFSDFETAFSAGTFLMSIDNAVKTGLCSSPEYDRALVWFDEGLSEAEMVEISESIAATPDFMRFDLKNISMQTDSEKQINAAVTTMLCFFFGMLYLSLCTMIFVDASLKITKMRSEIAVLRQVGADDPSIRKTLRTETYLGSVMALSLTVAFFVVLAVAYLSIQTGYLYQFADRFPESYPPEVVAKIKRELQMHALLILSLILPSIPLHALSAGVNILGTLPPLKRILSESITEGLRKDTD